MADTGRTEITAQEWAQIPGAVGTKGFYQNASKSVSILLRESTGQPTELYPSSYKLDGGYIGDITPTNTLWARVNRAPNSTMTAILVHPGGGDNLSTPTVAFEILLLDNSGNVVMDNSNNALVS